MVKNFFLFSILFLEFFFSIVLYGHGPLISELMPDAITYNDSTEWVEIYNNTPNPVSIDGWKISDGEATLIIPSNGYYLYPEGKITISYYAETFKNQYGFAPDFACSVGTTIAIPLSGTKTALANTGDQVFLKNANDSIIDCFAYLVPGTSPDSVWYPISITPSSGVSFIRDPQGSEGAELFGEVSESLSVVWGNAAGQSFVGPEVGGLHPQGLTIKNFAQNPASPTFLDEIIISCNATSDTTVNNVQLYWTINNFTSTDSSIMNKQADDTTFIDTIPPYPVATDVRYYLKATDDKGATLFSPPTAPVSYYRYIVADTGESYFEIHFNKTVEIDSAKLYIAEGEDSLDFHLCKYIHNAQKTIDCCFYDFDRQVVADSLVAAHNRGIDIRFITDNDNETLPQVTQLETVGITVIDDAFPTSYVGSNLMHNKFRVIDTTYTFTGSWNITDNCTDRNANNSIIINDRQIAENYIKEFTEMWGSSTLTPDSFVSNFSTQKSDNISHIFIVDNDTVKVYMSPSDGCASKLISEIATANKSIYFCIFSFTHQGICDAMKLRYDTGVIVRGVFNATSWNVDYSKSLDLRGLRNLASDNNPWTPPADVFLDSVDGNLLHHKYMLIDCDKWDSNPIVVTGSFNWSASAEEGNDENLILIHSKYFADLFLQEFFARYHEAGGTAEYSIDTKLEQINIFVRREKGNVVINYSIDNALLSSVEIDFNEEKVFASPSLSGKFVHKNNKAGKYNIFALRRSGVREHLGQFYIDGYENVLSVISENNLWTKKSIYKARVSGEGIVNISIFNALGEAVENSVLDLSKGNIYSPKNDIAGGIYYVQFNDQYGNKLTEKVLRVK